MTTEHQREYLSKFVLKCPVPFQALLGPLREQRSLTQNARYWKLIALAAEVTGYSKEEMHEFALCRHFGFSEVERKNPLTGKQEITRVPMNRSSTRNKKEFRLFMDETEAWFGTELGAWLA